jgi:hypothetical protein
MLVGVNVSCKRSRGTTPAPSTSPAIGSATSKPAQRVATAPVNPAVAALALQNAEDQARAVADAMIAGDFRKAVLATYPKVVEMNGGAARMEKLMVDGSAQMLSDGVRMELATIGAPTWSDLSGARWFAVLPETVTLRTPTSRLVQDSYVLGVSEDHGASWRFIDGAGLNERNLKVLLPDAPATLKLPAKRPTRQLPLLRTPAPPR